ncbi:hypothetical protein [Desertivirga brevis]|uniref:hypothetical protein n=1 Tax=Desertivirga brevis TaxID=2810310 RepID=UPI001A96F24C|nr:hypothetical protein [Pedobacter sp. SYSU D00873]
MKLPVLEKENQLVYSAKESDENYNNLEPQASYPNGDEDEEPEDDDDYEETYGDLEDGHNDLNEQDSDQGVDNLE